MQRHLTYIVTALCASTVLALAAPDKAALEAKENAAWQAFKDKKPAQFKKIVSPDVMAVYADGIYDMQKEVDGMARTDMKSFTLSDFKVVMTDRDTALVTSKAKVESSADGQDNSGEYNCGSVWQMKNGEWHAVFHADMKAVATAK